MVKERSTIPEDLKALLDSRLPEKVFIGREMQVAWFQRCCRDWTPYDFLSLTELAVKAKVEPEAIKLAYGFQVGPDAPLSSPDNLYVFWPERMLVERKRADRRTRTEVYQRFGTSERWWIDIPPGFGWYCIDLSCLIGEWGYRIEIGKDGNQTARYFIEVSWEGLNQPLPKPVEVWLPKVLPILPDINRLIPPPVSFPLQLPLALV